MLKINRFKRALREDRAAVGLLSSIPSPLMVEMIGYAGFDFVVLDMEHGRVDPQTLEDMIRAAECADITPLVRVSEPGQILHVLDGGAQGVILPHVCSAGQAERAVRAAHYHPLGTRGISGGRTTGFGTLDLAEYIKRTNNEIMVGVMIEDRAGVDAIDEIARVPGVDLVIEGAVDLSQSYGVPTQLAHPSVTAAIRRIAEACRDAGTPFCAVPRAPGQHERWREFGVRTFLVGDERRVAFRALAAHRERFL